MLNNNCLESEVYMKRKIYESPLTLRTEVELEGEFMKASVFEDEENTENLTIEDHKVDETFDFSGDNDSWD